MTKFILGLLATMYSFSSSAQVGEIRQHSDSTASPLSVSASGFYYIFPGSEKNSLTMIGYLDYKSIHIEPRYNYEAENSGSIFAGYTFEAGKSLHFTATPMAGFVFGSMNGLAPGLELELSYKAFDFYTENEFVADLSNGQNNFFYTWSELGYSPLEKFRIGLTAQRTRLYETGLDIQRGFFAEYSFWKLTAGVHYYNPFSSNYFFITSLSFEL